MMENPPQPSPASHAAGLKYAKPRDLPSFPSHGLSPDGAAASAAASLGWANRKTVELWKPDESPSASAAAAMAKDYRLSPTWEPASSSEGARAASLAVGSADVALKHASAKTTKGPHDGWGNSAATQAFHAPRTSSIREADLSHGNSAATQAFHAPRPPSARDADLSHGNSAATQAFHASRAPPLAQTVATGAAPENKSLAAAKGAMSLKPSSSRPRSMTTPSSAQPGQPSPSAAASALNGATLAHRASLAAKSNPSSAGAIPVTTMTRNMFTSHPPVRPEIDEQENNEKLHQSAVAMARKMFIQQQKMLEQAKDNRQAGSANAAGQQPQYLNLQDAAYKQAQERLAKLQTEHMNNRELQEYYGNYGNSQPAKRRFSMANKLRRRSSSEADLEDVPQPERIRQQMSMFSTKLSEVDKSKRDKDREALLAAAQRNVKARLQGMDEKVYQDTGMVNPTMQDTFETKAQETAQLRHESRNVNKGKVDIGGGRFMDPDEVDAIAAKRVQPILDDMNERAEIERERLAVLKLDEEAKKAGVEKQKVRDREVKEINKKLKEQEKQEEKAKKAEQKRAAKEEKRRSKHEPLATAPVATAPVTTAPVTTAPPLAPPLDTTMGGDTMTGAAPLDAEQSRDALAETLESQATPVEANDVEFGRRKSGDSPTSPTAKVKGWIKNRFSRGKSISETNDKKKGFLGGAALRGSGGNASATSLDQRANSMRDVALAGRENQRPSTAPDSRGVSPVSSDDEDEPHTRSRRENDMDMAPPRPIEDPVVRTSSSPTRDSRFREEMDN